MNLEPEQVRKPPAVLNLDVIGSIVANEARRAVQELQPNVLHLTDPRDQFIREVKGILPEEFNILLKLATLRRNIMIVGPAGCGKTYIAERIADALGLPFSSISCTAGMSESQLLGWLLPTGEGGKFEYQAAPFVDKYENGGVFLLDELDSGDSNTLMILNQALSSNKFFVPQRLGNQTVHRHPDFVCIAACNTFGQGADMVYVGRNQLDGATLDRFAANTVKMEYSPIVEKALIHPEVLRWGVEIRNKIEEAQLHRILSTRIMIDFTLMVDNYDMELEEWESRYFQNWSSEEISRVKDTED